MPVATLVCSRCKQYPQRFSCPGHAPKCKGQWCRSKSDWNWQQVNILILKRITRHQKEHGKGTFPPLFQIPTEYFRHIPKQLRGKIYNVPIQERKQQ